MRDTQITEAIYSNGVLKPVDPLELREAERVRLIVQQLDQPGGVDREEAFRRLKAGIAAMNFRLRGPLPARDELHDRS